MPLSGRSSSIITMPFRDDEANRNCGTEIEDVFLSALPVEKVLRAHVLLAAWFCYDLRERPACRRQA